MKNKNLINEIVEIIHEEFAELEEDQDSGEKKWTIKHKNKEGKTVTLTIVAPQDVYDNPTKRRQAEDNARKKSEKKKKKKKKRERVSIGEKQEETNENWFKGSKDQLLFEELTKKWAKKR